MERLKRRADFRAAAAGNRTSGRGFVLQVRRRRDGDAAVRVGFTVSRHVGNAVERNRVRRRLRELVRLTAVDAAGVLHGGHDYVLIGRRAALELRFGEMKQDLYAALRRIHHSKPDRTGGAARPAPHEAYSPDPPRHKPRRNRPIHEH